MYSRRSRRHVSCGQDDLRLPALYADQVNRSLAACWQWWRASTARDVISAVLVTAVLVAGAYGEAHPNQPSDVAVFHSHADPAHAAAALLLVAVACLVLAVKRRAPVAVLLGSTAAIVAYSALGFVNGAALLAPAIALFAVAQAGRCGRPCAGGHHARRADDGDWAGEPIRSDGRRLLPDPALIAAPLFGGIAVSNRRAYVKSIAERAEEEALRRVDEERLRIARELHDIVAHSMATISVQAGVAEHVLESNPGAAVDALRRYQAGEQGRAARAAGDPQRAAPGRRG